MAPSLPGRVESLGGSVALAGKSWASFVRVMDGGGLAPILRLATPWHHVDATFVDMVHNDAVRARATGKQRFFRN